MLLTNMKLLHMHMTVKMTFMSIVSLAPRARTELTPRGVDGDAARLSSGAAGAGAGGAQLIRISASGRPRFDDS